MKNINDVLRQVKNLISVGTVTEVDASKSLAKVDILGRETDFLPVVQRANSFKREFIPVRVGEQVVVLCPDGDSDFGTILGSIFNQGCKEPSGSGQTIEITEYEDGTKVSYDVSAKELKIEATNKITIIASGDVDVTCANASVKAESVAVDSSSIDLGLGGKGVVTGECKCAFTGLPHPDMSGNTRSKM